MAEGQKKNKISEPQAKIVASCSLTNLGMMDFTLNGDIIQSFELQTEGTDLGMLLLGYINYFDHELFDQHEDNYGVYLSWPTSSPLLKGSLDAGN